MLILSLEGKCYHNKDMMGSCRRYVSFFMLVYNSYKYHFFYPFFFLGCKNRSIFSINGTITYFRRYHFLIFKVKCKVQHKGLFIGGKRNCFIQYHRYYYQLLKIQSQCQKNAKCPLIEEKNNIVMLNTENWINVMHLKDELKSSFRLFSNYYL